MEHIDKIVDFEYCKQCKYEDRLPSENPCHDCLNSPTNTYSHKPINFKEKSKKKNNK